VALHTFSIGSKAEDVKTLGNGFSQQSLAKDCAIKINNEDGGYFNYTIMDPFFLIVFGVF